MNAHHPSPSNSRLGLVRAVALAATLAGAVSPAAADVVFVDGPPNTVPQRYVVQEGDTLWDICESWFGNGFVWPSIWAINPHVTNPHWIYPGDVLRLRLPAGGSQMSMEVPSGALPGQYTSQQGSTIHVSVNEGFLVDEDDEKEMTLGVIKHSPLPMQWLADTDTVYVEFEKPDEVRPGQRYTVFREEGDVDHPETGKDLGKKIRVVGVLEVTRVDEDKLASARLVHTFTEVERGARVGPLLDHYRYVAPRQNLVDLEGTLVDRLPPLNELAQFHLVFLDRGSEDGVQTGNRFFVLRRGDEYMRLERKQSEDDIKRMPWERIGEVLVVETRDRTSVAIVTRSDRELKVGDRVAMQRLY